MPKPTDVKYFNDRRDGVTNPDKIEIIEKKDVRHAQYFKPPNAPNRAQRRAAGYVTRRYALVRHDKAGIKRQVRRNAIEQAVALEKALEAIA